MKKLITILLTLSSLAFATSNPGEVLTISQENTVIVNMPIFSDSAAEASKQLLEKNKKLAPNKPIYLVLDTPGGSIDDGLKLIEIAKSLPRPVHTINLFSASMGFVIAQHLDSRFVIDSSTLMSHRATVGGIKGEYPGSFLSRVFATGNQLMAINSRVAARAGIPVNTYLDLIRNELWLGPDEAISYRFADKKVTLRCDESLNGYGEPQELSLGIFSVKIQFHKCPLISQPRVLKGDSEVVNMLVNRKMDFMNTFGTLLK